jgi:hypothetical protein
MADVREITLEGVRIIFRNFSGLAGRFNTAGDRNFCVCIPDDIAKAMTKDGWNVRWLQPRSEDDVPQAYLKVSVKYENKEGRPVTPPRVVMITSRGKTKLSQDMVAVLDWADIINVDMIIRPYEYDVGGRTGISAYLKSLYAEIKEDELELKYIDVPDSAQSAVVEDQAPF